MWVALFKGAGQQTINGFPFEAYVGYAVWAAFIARVTSTWMYEFRMIDEIDSGSINSLLVRPFSFFEYYLSQFLGYKLCTTVVSLVVPIAASLAFSLPVHWERLPAVFLLVTYYLFLVQTLSFIVASSAFHINRAGSITVAKNLTLWLCTGELIPLDLFPQAIRSFLLALPFSNAAYVPVAFLTGRIDLDAFLNGIRSITIGLLVLAPIAAWAWRRGIRKYAGTGA